MHFATILPLLVASVLAGGPGQPSNQKYAPEGPDKLEECGCGPIYKKMVECQPVKGVNENIRDCVCLPNSEPDAWYGYIHSCRACLDYDNESDEGQLFFNSMSSVITQLFTSCTENGGGVVSDGRSICASAWQYEACAGLNEGRDSWASVEGTDGLKNATFFLNIDDGKEDEPTKSSSSASLPSASNSALPSSGSVAPSSSATPSASGTETSAAPSASGSDTSSAMRLIGSGSQVGALAGVAAAFGVGAMLL